MCKKLSWGAFSLFLLCTLVLAGCKPETPGDHLGAGGADTIPVHGDWVRIYHSSDPDGLHPYNARNAFATIIKENIYMYLADYNSQTLQPEPTLAKGPAEISADGLSFTYEMRPEARWDNGDPITGYDYQFSIKCLKNPLTDNAQQRSYYSYVQDVKVDPSNDRRFTVLIDAPFFLAETGIAGIEVISKNFYDSSNVMGKYTVADIAQREAEIAADPAIIAYSEKFNGEKYNTDPAHIYGSGPYKLESWTTGDNVTLVHKKDWWGDKLAGKSYFFQGYPEKLIFKTIKDRTSLPVAAKNGELDVVRDMSPDDFIAARDDTSGYIYKNFNFHTPPSYSYIFLAFNCKPTGARKPILDDVRVRKAISHLTDIESIIANVYNGFGKRQVGPISPLHPEEYHAALKGYEFDPEKAKALLDEAGWIDADGNGVREKMIKGKKIELKLEAIISNSGETGPRMLSMIADQAQKVGMIIEINKIDFGTLSGRLRSHDFDIAGLGFSSAPLPTDLKQVWESASWAENGSNYFGFGDTTTDALIDQIRHTLSAEERTPLYHRFQEIWLEQLPMLVIMSPTERIWIHKRFHHANPSSIRPGYKPYEFWVPVAEQKFK